MIYNYNLHDIVKVQTNKPDLTNYLTTHFLTEEEFEERDLVINIFKDFNVYKNNFERQDKWFYGKNKEEFVYYEDNILGKKDKILLSDICGETTISATIDTLKLEGYIVPRSRGSLSDLINIVIDLKLFLKGFVVIHATCLAKNNSAILLSAFPNVGKTLCTLQLLKKGFKYLGDDTVIVDTKGNVYCLPFVSTLGYDDFLRFIKPKDVGWRKYSKLILKGWFMDKNKLIERLFEPPKLDLLSIKGNELIKSSRVKVVCTLKIGNKSIRRIDKEELIRKILSINEYSMPRIIKNPFFCVYSYFNNFDLERVRKKEKKNIAEFLDNCECFELACNDLDWASMVEEIIK